MRRRRLLLGAGVLALLGVAGGLVVWLVPHPGAGITPENYRRIREGPENYGRIRQGLTEAGVEAIFGCPAGNYSGKNVDDWAKGMETLLSMDIDIMKDPNGPPASPLVFRLWVGEDVAVLVFFRDAKAQGSLAKSVADQHITAWDRLRRLLPW